MKYFILAYQLLGRFCATIILVAGAMLMMRQTAFAKDAYATVTTPGIHFSQQAAYQLPLLEKNKLLASLRRITGWQQLCIDETDRLRLECANEFVGGSVWARWVINEVLRSGNRFVIENHVASATVNFGQLDEGTRYSDDRTGTNLLIYRVRLDFADFQNMEATPEVRETFDEGFTFFHELLHGLGLQDTDIHNEIGDCEHLVNKMRADLRLPLRDQYLGDLLYITPKLKTVRLRFKSPSSGNKTTSRWKKHYLFFVLNSDVEWEPRSKVARQSQVSKEKLLTALSE